MKNIPLNEKLLILRKKLETIATEFVDPLGEDILAYKKYLWILYKTIKLIHSSINEEIDNSSAFPELNEENDPMGYHLYLDSLMEELNALYGNFNNMVVISD